MEQHLIDAIFSIQNSDEFETLALKIFQFQAQHCQIYQQFIQYLKIDARQIQKTGSIPFLPIEFFKNHAIISVQGKPEIIFGSSGTTQQGQSSHLLRDLSIYEKSFTQAFERLYGPAQDMAIIGLLPSYLERDGSSLIYMVNTLMKKSKYPQSGYFLYNHQELADTLTDLRQQGIPTLLIGVTYALLDFLENQQLNFPDLIVMETGGMKGRRKEIVRAELHKILSQGFGVSRIHSEYGMTELLSQAYSKGWGIFKTPPWMQVRIRDTNDPLSNLGFEQTGGINIIDLANIYSCSFIATQDLGKLHASGLFEVLGRFDNSDIRGCNLLVQ